jgi:hypothetical protein
MGGAHPERLSFITSVYDGSNRPFQIFKYILGRQSQHSKAAHPQVSVAAPIPLRSVSAIMRFTVNLNRQPRF